MDPPSSATTEPATPTPVTPGTVNGSSSRRPPRKSTLTQQQKNQKRQRATQDQLITLEVEFNKNPTPTAVVRERIAQEINMTERSVQIWFQNRFVTPTMGSKSAANGPQESQDKEHRSKEHRKWRGLREYSGVDAQTPRHAGTGIRQGILPKPPGSRHSRLCAVRQWHHEPQHRYKHWQSWYVLTAYHISPRNIADSYSHPTL